MTRAKKAVSGRLIVFEGVDGVGKTTISRRLAAHLTRRGVRTRWFSFPGHIPGTLGSEIYRIHHSKWARKLDPLSVQLLHIGAHIEQIRKKILPALEKGEWVVLDRYWWSTQVYGISAGADHQLIQKLIAIEQDVWGLITPSVAFLVLRKTKGKASASQVLMYRKLAAAQSSRHPVRLIENDSTLNDLFQRVISTELLARDLPK